MGLFILARVVVFAVSLLFSVIVLGLAADVISITEEFDFYWICMALAVATAVLTLATVVPMLVVDWLRRGAFTSLVIVEVVWLSILWILWLSTGAYAAWTDGVVYPGSSCDYFSHTNSQVCQEFKAIMAFSFLTWILLMAYTITLLVFAFIGQSRGNRTWTSTVRDTTFLAPSSKGHVGSNVMVQPTPAPAVHEAYPGANMVPTPSVPMQVSHTSTPAV
ncbi:hypothetical protein DENSPDRAFT_876220 [Dentipellis sp. KUC8613]|nr:hypothetical protein DENSPDRAFT_876220 [Dentipellis sp. KUC8613]